MKKHAKHVPHSISLLGILGLGFVGIIFFYYDRGTQVAIALSMGVSYFVWGIVHHISHKDIDLTVVLEYLTISILGTVVLLSLLYRS